VLFEPKESPRFIYGECIKGSLDSPIVVPSPTTAAGAIAGTFIAGTIGTVVGAKVGSIIEGALGSAKNIIMPSSIK